MTNSTNIKNGTLGEILAFNFWLSDYHMQDFYFFVSHLHT
jgi:hypothetical protein